MIEIILDHKSRKAFVKLDNMVQETRRGIRAGFHRIGKKLLSDTSTDILRKPRYGRAYKYKGRRHIASEKGESFANRSGEARRNLKYTVTGFDKMTFGFDSSVEYPKFLEENLERPTLELNVKKNEKTIRDYLEQEIRVRLK